MEIEGLQGLEWRLGVGVILTVIVLLTSVKTWMDVLLARSDGWHWRGCVGQIISRDRDDETHPSPCIFLVQSSFSFWDWTIFATFSMAAAGTFSHFCFRQFLAFIFSGISSTGMQVIEKLQLIVLILSFALPWLLSGRVIVLFFRPSSESYHYAGFLLGLDWRWSPDHSKRLFRVSFTAHSWNRKSHRS